MSQKNQRTVTLPAYHIIPLDTETIKLLIGCYRHRSIYLYSVSKEEEHPGYMRFRTWSYGPHSRLIRQSQGCWWLSQSEFFEFLQRTLPEKVKGEEWLFEAKLEANTLVIPTNFAEFYTPE